MRGRNLFPVQRMLAFMKTFDHHGGTPRLFLANGISLGKKFLTSIGEAGGQDPKIDDVDADRQPAYR